MELFKTISSTIKTIKPGHRLFKIHNGLMMCDRASVEISRSCPRHIADIIAHAYQNGWITPVAHVTEKEYMLLGLSND